MAAIKQLPCNDNGVCMVCKHTPSQVQMLFCDTCLTPWHSRCLISPPQTISAALVWVCPNCTYVDVIGAATDAPAAGESSQLHSTAIVDRKGKGKMAVEEEEEEEEDDERTETDSDINIVDVDDEDEGIGSCTICLRPLERPVTGLCGHNFCLKCFEEWMSRGRPNCPKCRSIKPSTVARNPRVNSIPEKAIRETQVSIVEQPPQGTGRSSQTDRPDAAFTTVRAKKAGLANASSGRILVTVPRDHFGPITAQNDPQRNRGVSVGDFWMSRMEVRQWGVHIAHISGISGQSKNGAQSVVLSGGYADDEDHGDWFLYTGSGGRDLTGNRRTNKKQSSHQHFTKNNESLRLSCEKGYPVRVVRAYKNKRSAYSPQAGYRYDGIYRIERCWRKVGVQGYLICRYLFIRCDNEPAPWNTSVAHGDLPRPTPHVSELRQAIDDFQREETPSWDFDEVERCWMWKKPPPPSKEIITNGDGQKRKRRKKNKQSIGQPSNDISDLRDNPQVNSKMADFIRELEGGTEENVEVLQLPDGVEEEMEEFEALCQSDDEEET